VQRQQQRHPAVRIEAAVGRRCSLPFASSPSSHILHPLAHSGLPLLPGPADNVQGVPPSPLSGLLRLRRSELLSANLHGSGSSAARPSRQPLLAQRPCRRRRCRPPGPGAGPERQHPVAEAR